MAVAEYSQLPVVSLLNTLGPMMVILLIRGRDAPVDAQPTRVFAQQFRCLARAIRVIRRQRDLEAALAASKSGVPGV